MNIEQREAKPDKGSYRSGFTKVNGYLLLLSLLLITIGYLLMSGGSSPDGVSFDESVFSTRRIVLAPVICAIGYLDVVVAILYRGRVRK